VSAAYEDGARSTALHSCVARVHLNQLILALFAVNCYNLLICFRPPLYGAVGIMFPGCPSVRVCVRARLPLPRVEAEFCDDLVCLSVCLSVCLPVCLSAGISLKLREQTLPNFYAYCRGSVPLRRGCDTICTSGFSDDFINLHIIAGNKRSEKTRTLNSGQHAQHTFRHRSIRLN